MFNEKKPQGSRVSKEVDSSTVSSNPDGRRAVVQNITMFSGSSTEIIPGGLNPEHTLFIKIIKGTTIEKRLFTAYLLLNEEQKDEIQSNKKPVLNKYEIFYKKFGHNVSHDLHSEIMHFFALRYLNRPIRYVANDLPIDKEYFTEEDFFEREPVVLSELKVKHLKFIPSKLQINPVSVQEEIVDNCTERQQKVI